MYTCPYTINSIYCCDCYRAVYKINYSYNIYVAAINAAYTYDNYCVVDIAVCM